MYLLPVTLGDTAVERVLPPYNREVILQIKYFIVEDVRSARRFLKKVDASIDIDKLTFFELNKHTQPEVISLVGPSSIILSVMGAGFNGQNFAFNGYLPIDPSERARRIKELENRVYSEDQTQLFIETPYRNRKLLEEILHVCRPQTRLCIAANITCEGEYIRTRTVKEWKGRLPELNKIPCIFLIYK